LIVESKLAFLGINLAYFGLIAFGLLLAGWNPKLRNVVTEGIQSGYQQYQHMGDQLTSGEISHKLKSPDASFVLLTMIFIFLVNLLFGSFAAITLPSLFLPFSGLVVGALRAVLWGILFFPDSWDNTPIGIIRGILPFLVIFLEGEGYVFALLGTWIHGKAVLVPETVGAVTRRKGYRIGLRRMASMYIPIAIFLFVSAVYESILWLVIQPSI
jgi:hypothetical protein